MSLSNIKLSYKLLSLFLKENLDDEMAYKDAEIRNLNLTISHMEEKNQLDRISKIKLEEEINEYDERHLKLLNDFNDLKLGMLKINFYVIGITMKIKI